MWYLRHYSLAIPVVAGLAALASGGTAGAATLDVCATCTHTTLDSAIAAAAAGDTIILDGPDDDVALPPVDYTLATNLLIGTTLADLEIRGDSKSRPDQIRVIGTGTGPVITVEAGQTFEARNFTIMGGTTGVLAMSGSDVDIRQCLIEGITGVGVDCVSPANVYLAATVIADCTGDAVRIDSGGEVNISQCTFLRNGLGVNALSGIANVVATLIHDCGAGMADPLGTALDVAGNWVTDASGAVIPNPGGATDPYAKTDPLDPGVVFDTSANSFPGQIAFGQAPLTDQAAATLTGVVPVPFFAQDFSGLTRDTANVVIGADEVVIAAATAAWTECYIIQRGAVRDWVGEGPLTIEISTRELSLGDDAVIWIGHPASAAITDPTNRIGPLPIETPSIIDDTYGFVDFTVDLDAFDAAFAALMIDTVNTDGYEIFIHTAGETPESVVPDLLDGTDTVGTQAEEGRIFGIDSIPPQVVTINALADQYLASPTDGSGFDPGPSGWGAGLMPGATVGANAGWLNGLTGDPQIFFDGTPSPFPPPATDPPSTFPNPLDFTIAVTFTDVGSGFETVNLPVGTASTQGDKDALLYEEFRNVPGSAWWARNQESFPELIQTDGAPTVEANYTVSDGNLTLQTNWTFANARHDLTGQWHAVANIRVMDLAGNETTLDTSGLNFVPLKPLHLWWFPYVAAELRVGPSGAETTNPVFTWGLERFGGQDPQDPQPVFPSVQFKVWKLRTVADPPGFPWMDITGGTWSQWMNPANRSITMDTYFSSTVRLRDLIAGAGGEPGRQYLIALRGYDEAGNLQPIPAPANGDFTDVSQIAPLPYNWWTDPGADESAALDTSVQARFWHNLDGGRVLDPDERDFGSATRIPLPPYEPCPSPRVEAGFDITMGLPDSVAPNAARVYFSLYEDGRFVSEGVIDPSSVPSGHTFVIPADLLDPAIVGLLPDPVGTAFLNDSICDPGFHDRLGDDGDPGPESAYRQRDVTYTLLLATQIGPLASPVRDRTPATVEFTVTVDRGLRDDQPVKSFTQE